MKAGVAAPMAKSRALSRAIFRLRLNTPGTVNGISDVFCAGRCHIETNIAPTGEFCPDMTRLRTDVYSNHGRFVHLGHRLCFNEARRSFGANSPRVRRPALRTRYVQGRYPPSFPQGLPSCDERPGDARR